MESVLLAASIYAAATTFAPANAPVEPPAASPALDQSCFRLMADLAEDQDPRVRGLGRLAAQYFLGRLDAAQPGFDPDAALAGDVPLGAERSRLLSQCGDAMQAGGRDFRSIGDALAPRGRPTV